MIVLSKVTPGELKTDLTENSAKMKGIPDVFWSVFKSEVLTELHLNSHIVSRGACFSVLVRTRNPACLCGQRVLKEPIAQKGVLKKKY